MFKNFFCLHIFVKNCFSNISYSSKSRGLKLKVTRGPHKIQINVLQAAFRKWKKLMVWKNRPMGFL